MDMDEFSDDGFDELNDTALQELESRAIQATQAQKYGNTQAAYASGTDGQAGWDDYGYVEDEEDDLDDAVVIDEATNQPPRPYPIRSTPPNANRNFAPPLPSAWSNAARPPAPGVSGTLRPAATAASLATGLPTGLHSTLSLSQRQTAVAYPPTRHGPPPSFSASMRPPPPRTQQQHPPLGSQQLPLSQLPYQDNIVAALQARVRSLESDLTSAKGEVAIVRSKLDKSAVAHETELNKLKARNAEVLSKQERIAENAIQAQRTAATELQFARQDLKDEVSKTRKGKRDQDAMLLTPSKRGKSAVGGFGGVADGFDDRDMLPSPSKMQNGGGRNRSRAAAQAVNMPPPPALERTPTKNKRKRPNLDSPVKALEVEDDMVMTDAESPRPAHHTTRKAQSYPEAVPYGYLQLLLEHRSDKGQSLTFELFSRYCLPSTPMESFAAKIFAQLPSMGNTHEPLQLLVDLGNVLIGLWTQCIQESYYIPTTALAALVTFMLQLNTSYVAPRLIDTLMPIAQKSVQYLAVPRYQTVDGDLSVTQDPLLQRQMREIRDEEILDLIYLATLGCVHADAMEYSDQSAPEVKLRIRPIVRVWTLITAEVVFLFLSPKQPPSMFLRMLKLLSLSHLPESIGPVCTLEGQDSDAIGKALVERLSLYLSDPPRWATDTPGLTSRPGGPAAFLDEKSASVRLEALKTLVSFSESPFGSMHLATNALVIPRVVTMLSGAIDALYDLDIPLSLFASDEKPLSCEDSQTTDTMVSEELGSQEPVMDSALAELLSQMALAAEEEEERGSPPPPNPAPHIHAIISNATLLLHRLVTDPATAEQVKLSAKLAASHGGSQRYLLALARLTFTEEDAVLEAGVDAATAERATELLEMLVTPDEGEGISAVFGP